MGEKYEVHGARGLIKNNEKYDGKFKINVIKYMHENRLSNLETAIHFNLSADTIVSKWERIYYEEGASALYEERRGRSRKMSIKCNKKKLSKETEEDLIEEVQRLRMENAYLKKIERLNLRAGEIREEDKAQAINELRREYKLVALLEYAGIARSTFYYYLKKMKKTDKYSELRS